MRKMFFRPLYSRFLVETCLPWLTARNDKEVAPRKATNTPTEALGCLPWLTAFAPSQDEYKTEKPRLKIQARPLFYEHFLKDFNPYPS